MSGGARPLALLSVLALLLAGCLQSSSSTVPSSLRLPELPPVPGLPIVQDHDHADPALHAERFATALVGQASGYEGPVPAGVFYTELDVRDGTAYVCRAGATEGIGPLPATHGGFVVIDVQEPAAPKAMGRFDGVGCADIKANADGDLVIYATQRNPLHEPLTNAAPPAQKAPRGFYLVNVEDKAAPFLERFHPLPVNGVHTLHYARMDGRDVLFVQTYDWVPDGGLGVGVSTGLNNPATQRVQVFEIVRAADGLRAAQPLGLFTLPGPAPPGSNYFPHDVTVQKHPLTGQWLGYVAYWDHGLVIVDLADLAQPKLVSAFGDTSPSAYVSIHQARPFPHLIAGRHVTVLEPELSSADESGQFTLVDTTDPVRPQRLGHWKLPGDIVIPGGFLFSPHNFNLANGRIYLAHNHAGVWVVDVGSEERLLQPRAVGFYQPHTAEREAQDCAGSRVWSAFYVQGHVYATDSCGGLNVLRFEGDAGLGGPGAVMVSDPAAGV